MRSVSPMGGSLKRFGRVLDTGFEGVSGRCKEKNHVVSLKPLEIPIISVPLHRQSPPSLSSMLKCAGRFIFIDIQIWPNDIL